MGGLPYMSPLMLPTLVTSVAWPRMLLKLLAVVGVSGAVALLTSVRIVLRLRMACGRSRITENAVTGMGGASARSTLGDTMPGEDADETRVLQEEAGTGAMLELVDVCEVCEDVCEDACTCTCARALLSMARTSVGRLPHAPIAWRHFW